MFFSKLENQQNLQMKSEYLKNICRKSLLQKTQKVFCDLRKSFKRFGNKKEVSADLALFFVLIQEAEPVFFDIKNNMQKQFRNSLYIVLQMEVDIVVLEYSGLS